jgi:hypothetical protein
LICPGDPPLLNVRLVLERIQTEHKEVNLFAKIQMAVIEYDRLHAAGKSAKDARAEVAEKYDWYCDESTFNKHRKQVYALLSRVRGDNVTGKN